MIATTQPVAGRQAEFTFLVDGLTTDDLRVTAFEGVEGFSTLYSFRLELVGDELKVDTTALLGRACRLEIAGADGPRFVHGIVQRFERSGHGAALTHYHARIVPVHWLLTRRLNSRVFQKPRCPRMRVSDIVEKVFADAGLPEGSWAVRLERSYEEREFVVQYRESDFDFVARLLEEEGMFFFFEHTADGHRLVLTDSDVAYQPIAGDGRLPYRDPQGLVPEREFVHALRDAREIQIGAVSLDAFDFKRPGHPLETSVAAKRFTSLQLNDYPGGYTDRTIGDRLSQDRLEEQQCAVHVAELRATARGLRPGATFTLEEHPAEAVNAEYVVTRVEHRGSQPQSAEDEAGAVDGVRYEAEARVIPSAAPYRAPRVTRRPVVPGSQTAIVVGPESEEIHTDEYGRVKVRFHWDRESGYDEHASCWIRVSQGWAGGQYGMLFLPRVGQEVIVSFLEGDPDRPIITGRVYNNDHMPPYALPENKTISTIRTCSSKGAKGGNELRFDDKKGAEQLLLFAERSLHVRARGSRYESIGGSRHETVAGDSFALVKKNSHSTVKLDRLEETNGSLHVRVEKDVKESVQGRKTTYVSKKYAILNSDGIVLESDTAITLKVKGNFIKVDATGVTIVGQQVNINSGGAADTWSWDSPDMLELPAPADRIEYGTNTRYSEQAPEQAGARGERDGADDPDDADETETSWIEIELVDDHGQPVPGEPYRVIEADGTEHAGTLNQKGQAHVAVKQPGSCRITFPRLDAAAWERS